MPVVQHNIPALNSYNYLKTNNNSLSKNLEKLSSGYRINRAGDDAAGLAISEKMRSQIAGLDRANANAADGVSLIQTAEGALTEVHSMLNRLVELGTESANGVYQESDRNKIQDEVDQILEEVDRISEATNFNGIKLLDGSLGLNDNAIAVSKVAADPGKENKTILNALFAGAGGVNGTSIHTSTKATAQVSPSFTVDLKNLNVTATSTAKKFTLDIGGHTFAITVKQNMNSSEIAAAIAKEVNGANGKGTKFAVGDVGFEGTFTAVGHADGTIEFIAAEGTKVNGDAAIGAVVTIKLDAGLTKTGDIVHALTNTVDAVKERPNGNAGVTLDLDTLVNDGAALTIEDKTFVFKVGLTSTTTASEGQILIDLSRVDGSLTATAASRIAAAVGEDGTATFKIGALGDGRIHVEQKQTDTTEYRTEDSLKKLFKYYDSAPKAAGVSIDINASKLKSGDSVRVDGKTYQFVGKGEEAEITGATAIKLGGLTSKGGLSVSDNTAVAQALASAIGNDAKPLLDGSSVVMRNGINDTGVTGGGLTLQIGDTDDAYNKVTVAVDNMSAQGLGLEGLEVTDQGLSAEAITKVNKAIEKVSENRGRLGALQNRLEHTQNNLSTTTENMTAAESAIRDVDMAKEMMKYTQNNVLSQAAQSMLAQANQQPQNVLQLLR